MATTPPRSARRSSTATSPSTEKKRLQGQWKDGLWWCNCEPRREAVLREVKKDTPNKGKWFWTCKVHPYCGFFLWRDAARLRETGLPSTTVAAEEPVARPKTPTLTQRPLTSFGIQLTPGRRLNDADATDSGSDEDEDDDLAAPTAMETPCPPSSKRKRDAFEDDSGGFGDLDSDEERQLAELADSSARKAAAQDAPVTPAADRTVDATSGLPTPSVARTLFPGAESGKRQKTVSFEEPAIPSPAVTPGAKRTDAAATPSSSPADAVEDVAEEVARLLRGQSIDDDAMKAVQAVLATSARRTKGISMGRDSARAELKKRDASIARLQERITALENKDSMQNRQITDMKADLMKMFEKI